MFAGLFNYDNPVWRAIGKFWDVMIVNILWTVCSIPLVTIGASTTALYYVTLRLVRDEDGYTFRSFFHSFKENFRQATIIWLLAVVSAVVLFTDLWFVLRSGQVAPGRMQTVLASILIGLSIIWVATTTYVFAVLARFYGSVKRILFNAVFMSVRHILSTAGIIVIDAAVIYLTFTYLPPLILFGVALLAYINSFFMHRIFQKYIPKDERDIHEMRPILLDEEEPEEAGEAAGEPKELERAGEAAGEPKEPERAGEAAGEPKEPEGAGEAPRPGNE